MSYKIFPLPFFEKQLKRLAKKYPSLKEEFLQLVENLEENPDQGISLGKNCYKIRLAISSKRKGKSGGARLITNIVVENEVVYLLSIYEKSEKQNITDKELDDLLNFEPEE